jgi:TolB-like protein/DNA-binding winged helix-turn-helix (wHTH) protein
MEQAAATAPDVTGYQVDDLTIDLGKQRVTRAGSDIPLPRLSFDLLVTLARAAPNFVSFDQLAERVWPGLVIAPETISQRVKLVRDALGDDTHAPRYIAGIRGRGYRMVAAVNALVNQPSIHAAKRDTDVSSNPVSSPPAVLPAAQLSRVVELPGQRRDWIIIVVIGVLALGLAYLVVDRFWISKRSAVAHPVTYAQQAAARETSKVTSSEFHPPPHSIAVLPFVNMSGDPGQEYFSDGLTEELLNSLSRINELQVAARTSSFSFKGKDTDIGTIAHELNVGAVLEGSVRRSANTVRISAQLVNGITGFHVWSETYDRNLGDVLKLQTDIATAVATALKVRLLGDVAAKIELGGTRNPAAFDAYLRGMKAHARGDAKAYPDAVAAYTEAIRLDPNYALAFAGRSIAYSNYAGEFAPGTAIRESFDKALADAHQALAIAPELAEGYLALALFFDGSLAFAQESEAHERARALAPGNAEVLRLSGQFAVHMGHTDLGLTALRRAVVLDPLNPHSHEVLGEALYYARRYQETAAAATDAISLDSDYERAYGYRGLAHYGLGDFEGARTSCKAKPDYWISQWCLALAYEKLGPHVEAEATLAKFEAENGDASAYQYATIYAQRGTMPEALEWLDTAVRVRDPGLVYLKTDPLLDPLRKEPRFQAIERALKFPD